MTLHGRALNGIVRYLQPGARILALAWDGTTPAMLARLLTERGMGKSHITVLECMGGARERVRSAEADAFALDRIDALNTIAVKIVTDAQSAVIPLSPGLDDTVYEHDGQLTKREIRAISLSSLAPRAGELLWDIGLGAGSIAIEWLLRHPSLRAIGIEQRADRAAHAARNAAALGTPDLTIIEGRAPEGLSGRPAPDAIFLGGGLSDGVLECAWSALKPGGRMVARCGHGGRRAGTVRRLSAPWRCAVTHRHGALGRRRQPARLATSDAGHPLAGDKAMMVAGIGCRSGASAEAIANVLAAALERCGLKRAQIDALATDAAKGNEAGILAAAAALGLPLIFVGAAQMKAAADDVISTSERVIALKGVPSVAETAALAAAGRDARLLVPRVANAAATCAIARGEGP